MSQQNSFSLDEAYSTTRHVINAIEEGGVESEKSLLPESKTRQGEGGLRTKGYFKASLPDKPLVTIITVVFNGEKQLEDTILSVINQNYDNIEFIVIDGGSNDGTLDILKKYDTQIDYWASEQDKGVYDAWNKGVSCSQGDWIAFLGADDVYFPEAINHYLELIKKSEDVQYISSMIELVSENKIIRCVGERWSWSRFKKRMNVAHVGSLHARSLYNEKGWYDLEYKVAGDYEFLLRFGSGLKAAYLNEITARMSVEGISNSNFKVFTETALAKCRHTGRWKLVVYLETMFSLVKWYVRRLTWY